MAVDFRRYPDESALDDLVAPPEAKPQMPEYMQQYMIDMAKAEAEQAQRDAAREQRSRLFRISEGSACGEPPDEEY